MGLPATRLTPYSDPTPASGTNLGAPVTSPGIRPTRPRSLGLPRPEGARRFAELRRAALTPLEEARALDARALPELPCVTVLELEVPGWAGPVWIRGELETARSGGDGQPTEAPRNAAEQTADPVLDGRAWLALVEAAESDRVRPVDFRELVARLAHAGAADASLDGAAEIAALMDGVRPEPSRHWTVGRVLERIGAKLFSVRVEDAIRAEDRASVRVEAPVRGRPANDATLAKAG